MVYVPLAFVLGDGPTGVAIAVVMGATFGLLGDDLRERLMLGDTGANVIGAVLGLAVVLGTSETTRLIVMVALVGLNVAAELVSFSSVIDRVPPLRAIRPRGPEGAAVGQSFDESVTMRPAVPGAAEAGWYRRPVAPKASMPSNPEDSRSN